MSSKIEGKEETPSYLHSVTELPWFLLQRPNPNYGPMRVFDLKPRAVVRARVLWQSTFLFLHSYTYPLCPMPRRPLQMIGFISRMALQFQAVQTSNDRNRALTMTWPPSSTHLRVDVKDGNCI